MHAESTVTYKLLNLAGHKYDSEHNSYDSAHEIYFCISSCKRIIVVYAMSPVLKELYEDKSRF